MPKDNAAYDKQESLRRHNEIERRIALDKETFTQNRPTLRILLLGQAESGKSTTLKAFKLNFAPMAFEAELEMWTKVIHLNLVRHINFILDVLAYHETETSNRPRSRNGGDAPVILTPDLKRLKLQLSPLSAVETDLRKQISPEDYDICDNPNSGVTGTHASTRLLSRRMSHSELAVRATDGIERIVEASRQNMATDKASVKYSNPSALIRVLAGDMKALWANRTVQLILKRYRVQLTELSGFFLDDIDRIVDVNYQPTADEVLRARLKTIGASEHRIRVEKGADIGKQWSIIDVGGTKRHRSRWASFFDTVDGIIFLAPVSTFDQFLEEEPTMNRMKDSFLLWKEICSNKILQNVNLILFMNKVDILRQKLEAGILFADYVESYKSIHGSRENNEHDIMDYLRNQLTSIHKHHSPATRLLKIFPTTVVDAKTTTWTLAQVTHNILESNLRINGML